MPMFNYPGIAAVILCGGQSRRMGTDKGLMTADGRPWVAILQRELLSLSLPVYISIRADQRMAYQALVAEDTLLVDQAWDNIAGPLVGILSAAQALPNRHLLIVPGDMPRLRRPVFHQWLDTFRIYSSAYQAFVSRVSQRWQPLCGIYHREGLDILIQRYQRGQLQNLSMQAILKDLLVTYSIEIPASLTPQFANYNTPEDLK